MTDTVSLTNTTPRHGLPLLFAGQAQKEFIVNEGLALLDTLVHPLVRGEAASPPASAEAGDCWLVAGGATDAFAGHDMALASWQSGGWLFVRPREGMVVRLSAGGSRVFRDGSWLELPRPPVPTGGETVDLEARGAIATLVEALAGWGIFSSQ